MAPRARPWGVFSLELLAGAFLGVLLLHPATMVIYWLEFQPEPISVYAFVTQRMLLSFRPQMLPMSVLFLVLGGVIGAAFGTYHGILGRNRRILRFLARELATDVHSLIRAGETASTEFKSSVRWDRKQQKVNKCLEDAIARTIAGFANHEGGSLLIGVSDDGAIVGLHADYQTLKRKDRDGFQQLIMSLVKERLGGHVCALVHPVFADIDGIEVCRLVIEPSDRPVYCSDRGFARYFLRTGNATRELDVREAVEHIRIRNHPSGPRRNRSTEHAV